MVALHCRFGAVGFAHGGARRWEDRGGAVPSFISRSRESKGGWDRGNRAELVEFVVVDTESVAIRSPELA